MIKFNVNFLSIVPKHALSLAISFVERAVDCTISLDYKNFGSPFFLRFYLKTSSQEVFNNKGVPKKFHKTHRKLYMPASLFQ